MMEEIKRLESVERGREVFHLRRRREMEAVERRKSLWKNLKERLALKGVGFCGSSSWGLRVSDMSVAEDEEEGIRIGYDEEEANEIQAASGMNLAAALAAERHLRNVGPTTLTVTPLKSLMRLFEETDGVDGKKSDRGRKESGGIDGMCCVCMERDKGTAFIPCGHTYCRVCSRELWLDRGSCPLCNSSINEILDIF